MDAVVPSEPLEHVEEERVAVAVVERDLGRCADDDEPARRVDAELPGHGRVGLEVGEVVLLFQAGVAAELRRPDAVARKPLRRDRVGHDDACRRAAAELVLEPGELVVEGGRARDPE